MNIVKRTKTYAVCPWCGADAGCVDHLLGQTLSTAWYCDACGHRYHLAFSGRDVAIAKASGLKVMTVDVLRLPPQSKPVYFVVEGMRFEDEGPFRDDDITNEEHKQFYYEEHSCPVNWLKPTMVYFDGDTDPHGLIEFVSTVDSSAIPTDENTSPNDHDRAVETLIESAIQKAAPDPTNN